MPSLTYYIEIENSYLGKYKRITGRTEQEVEMKAREQLFRWSQEEERAMERNSIASEKVLAQMKTEEALSLIEEYRNILRATLPVDDRISWKELRDEKPFRYGPPLLETIIERAGIPEERPFMESLRPSLARERHRLIDEARKRYEQIYKEYEAELKSYLEQQNSHNDSVEDFRRGYEAGEKTRVEEYISLVFANSTYPRGFPREFSTQYIPDEQDIIVDVEVPSPAAMPKILEYKYVQSRRVTNEILMKDKDFQPFYDEVVHQAVLRTLHEIFEGDYAGNCKSATVNGWVHGVDPATGRDFRSCIASCQVDRETFLEIDLSRINPEDCFRKLRGSGTTKLASLRPVAPMRRIERDDPRFIEAREVLEELESGQNLITIDWQDFEMLVRDLFEKVFSDEGTEVNVTRASRDEGVDAVVINPDPFKGGKTIIQAKRYRKSVPVAAVRELYGSMQNERAGRGILVTTGTFGKGAHDFARDKEIALLDGANLIHMLQNHGHNVKIDPTE